MLARLVVLAISAAMVQGHSYHLGPCPTVAPLPAFDMSKFLGKWYAIQKIHTVSRCLTYSFTPSSVPEEFNLEQVSEHPVLGLADVDNKYHYLGHLSVPSPSTPAEMIVKFPLSVAGSAVYTVFDTDYTNYGAVFTCQNAPFKLGHRRSVTILSRGQTLDKAYHDKILSMVSSFGIELKELDTIDQTNCPSKGQSIVDINVNEKKNEEDEHNRLSTDEERERERVVEELF
ncbi:apolipoprotein D-like [Macrosteles quadrilineatus]|uniref:apolipoprotein D-like n=1 Tax=Macrosteles quadrilineatus TaxID=74068 RepID=UPI0023E17B7D|nr:apolipoprotein D-like [Macrosteles quadrilineatus]XP_054265998.1 apolipoprotein D-like [Macrosteles quadrilineatus]